MRSDWSCSWWGYCAADLWFSVSCCAITCDGAVGCDEPGILGSWFRCGCCGWNWRYDPSGPEDQEAIESDNQERAKLTIDGTPHCRSGGIQSPGRRSPIRLPPDPSLPPNFDPIRGSLVGSAPFPTHSPYQPCTHINRRFAHSSHGQGRRAICVPCAPA